MNDRCEAQVLLSCRRHYYPRQVLFSIELAFLNLHRADVRLDDEPLPTGLHVLDLVLKPFPTSFLFEQCGANPVYNESVKQLVRELRCEYLRATCCS